MILFNVALNGHIKISFWNFIEFVPVALFSCNAKLIMLYGSRLDAYQRNRCTHQSRFSTAADPVPVER